MLGMLERRRLARVAGPALAFAVGLAGVAAAADVGVDAVLVSPASPAPSSICTLKVRVKNGGAQAASNFRFKVKVDGQDLALYDRQQTFAVNVDAGKSDELALYNFYSPASPKPFDVQVTLVEAQWVQIKKDGSNTTTTPTGPVSGLPSTASVLVKMAAGK
jgi:hypothetical protein